MNRKIKFRAWSNEHNKYCDFVTLDENSRWIGWIQCNKVFLTTTDIILEQFTRLLDRNGKEIYEGDIVEEDIDFNSKMTDGTFRYKVYWNEDELCWSLDPIGPESIHNDLWELNSSCRVIGNVHEPPKDFRPEHLKRMGVSISKGGEE